MQNANAPRWLALGAVILASPEVPSLRCSSPDVVAAREGLVAGRRSAEAALRLAARIDLGDRARARTPEETSMTGGRLGGEHRRMGSHSPVTEPSRMDGPRTPGPRLPDFLVIGTMKSGSTALYRWLGEHDGCQLPTVKEPDFFTRNFEKGFGWYEGHFSAVPPEILTGEASNTYTRPQWSEIAAKRIFDSLGPVAVLAILRHPVERARSHYRHDVQRGRQRRALADVIAGSRSNDYLESSCYDSLLDPYLRRWPADRIHIVAMERFLDSPASRRGIEDFLGLPPLAQAPGRFNETGVKRPYTRLGAFLNDRGRIPRIGASTPPLVRNGVDRLLKGSSTSEAYRRRLDSSREALPGWAIGRLRREAETLESRLGVSLWADL